MDPLTVAVAAVMAVFGLVALVPGVRAARSGRESRAVDVVVQARFRVPETARRRAWRADAIGVVFVAGSLTVLLVALPTVGLVGSTAFLATLFLRARRPEPDDGRPASSTPVELQTPYYPDAATSDHHASDQQNPPVP